MATNQHASSGKKTTVRKRAARKAAAQPTAPAPTPATEPPPPVEPPAPTPPDDADAKVGDLVQYVIPSPNGGDDTAGYAVVLDVVDVDDVTGGAAQKGKPSHTELLVAPLAVLGQRLTADHIVDQE